MRMRTVLILAYYFPPMGLGGVQRVLKFVKHLPAYGWRPIVVTVKDVRYYDRDESLLDEIPPDAMICRTGSCDPLRLGFLLRPRGDVNVPQADPPGSPGRTLARWCLFPDHQVGWVPFAVARAWRLIRSERVDAVLSTFPPASGHLAGLFLKRMTGLPWVADFRDGWTDGEFSQPPSPFHRMLTRTLERLVVRRADRAIAVSPEIAAGLAAVRGDAAAVCVLTNGYDPDDFLPPKPHQNGRLTMTYCGTINQARNPEPLFCALRQVLDAEPDLASRVHVQLVGAAIGLDLSAMIRQYRLDGVVTPFGYLPHRDALSHLVDADLLLLLVSSEDGRARGVPTGKIYECLATGRPILGLVPDGAARDLLLRSGRGTVVHPNDTAGIVRAIQEWVRRATVGKRPPSSPDETLSAFTRQHLTECLARILDDVITTR